MYIDFPQIWESHSVALLGLAKNLAAALCIIIAGIVLSRASRRLITASTTLRIDQTAHSLVRIVVKYGIFIVCVIMVLNVFGVNTASLIAVLGAAGVAVGLALKDTLSNIAAGIILLFLGSCRKDDYIECGSLSGTVRDMNLFTTILETPDGVYVSAPNSSIWGTPLKNYTRNGRRRMELTVGIAYSDSVETAFGVMRDITASEARFLKEPAPQVLLQSLSDKCVYVSLRAWALNADYWNIYWEQMQNLKIKCEEAGLHIQPRQDIHILS